MNLKDRLKYKPISTKPRKFFMPAANQNNESWVHRVIDELSELEKKIDALRLFLGSSKALALPDRSQADLR